MKIDKPDDELLNRMKVIKEGLADNQKGIYSIIVNLYETEIREFGAKIFSSSLESKLGLPKDTINLFSLRSAMSRIKAAPKSEFTFSNKKPDEPRDIDQDKLGFQ